MFDTLRIKLREERSVTLSIRARPGARKTEIKGMLADGSIKVSIHAPPEDGRANEELLKFLAEGFGVPVSHVELLSGQTSRMKIVRVSEKRAIGDPSATLGTGKR
jgi:hypothetical protein